MLCWTIDAAAARFAEDGEYLGYVGSVIDIDERRESELALEASEERLRLATEHAEIGFWDVDLVNDHLIWPPRVKAMFGISPEIPVSMADFYQGLHPEDRDRTAQSFENACDPALRALYEVEYRTIGNEDGIVRWVEARGPGFSTGIAIRVVGSHRYYGAQATEFALQKAKLASGAERQSQPQVYQLSTGPDGASQISLRVPKS